MTVRADGNPIKGKHAGKVRGRWLLEQGEDLAKLIKLMKGNLAPQNEKVAGSATYMASQIYISIYLKA